jgi:hypothetical protein
MHATVTFAPPRNWLAFLASGFRASWFTILLIVAINTGIAAIMSIEDPRPFWHPFISAQCFGLAIAYAVNAASPWEKTRPVWRLALAVAVGTVLGYLLVVLIKSYLLQLDGYTLRELVSDSRKFQWTLVSGFFNGLFVSLFFLFKFRETRADAALHRALAQHNLLAKQAVEAELKMMQAQVEPHFLFNTLASVQYLTETDPREASRLLGHLLAYLRAAVPQLRTATTTLGQEIALIEAYLNVFKTRMGPRLEFSIEVPDELRGHAFPPVLLISIVENAITHGLEPQAEGGTVRIEAMRNGERLRVIVTDTGRGVGNEAAREGHGVGLGNVRERLAALYGARARFTLEDVAPHGARSTIEIPYEELR